MDEGTIILLGVIELVAGLMIILVILGDIYKKIGECVRKPEEQIQKEREQKRAEQEDAFLHRKPKR